MANVAPGVYTTIIDLSEYVAGTPSTIGFLPIICEQGEDNKLISTNSRDFYIDFGEPNINYAGKTYGQGPYIASSFLKESESLYVVRCLPTDADYSNLVLYAEPGSLLGADTTADVTSASVSSINTTGELDTLVATDSTACVVFYGVGRGDYYDNYQIDISKHSNPQLSDPDTVGSYDLVYVLDIYKRQEDEDEEGQPQYEIIESYEVSFNPDRLDTSGESMFIYYVLDRYSRFIKCKVNELNCTRAINNQADFSQPFISGAINLDEGSTGTLFDANGIDGDVATQILGKAYQGILPRTTSGLYVDEVLDTDKHYFTIVLDGGYPTDVKTSINTLVRTRKDCLAIVDNGDNATTTAAISARDNDHTFNTRYMALYEPYNKIYDSYTGHDIWVSPIYHMANIIPYTDNIAEVWSGPAGTNRATIATIKELRFSPRLGDRNSFYLKQINPIVNFSTGNTVYSQLTTQKRPTALQDINITRLVLYVKRALEQFCKNYIFEYNDSETWSKISNEINAFLKIIQAKRGLYSYSVDVGATEYELKAKQIHVNVTLNPTRLIEQIYLNFFIV
jgi:hypothetical protein